jgi:transcription initiation factor TFIID subunit 2
VCNSGNVVAIFQLITHILSYFEIIKNPMDLSTMSAKLDQGKYKDKSAFEQDFRLLISNAKQYNMPKSAAYEDALELEKAFDIGMLF